MNQSDVIQTLRLQQVKRYAICHTHRDQSVAEHTLGVVIIARYLAEQENDGDLIRDVTDYALIHDVNEVFTGDIPSSFKRVLRQHYPGISELMDGPKPPKIVEQIVKFADYIEAVYYLREFNGSRLAQSILNDIRAKFAEFISGLSADEDFPPGVQAVGIQLMSKVQEEYQ